MTSLTAPLTDSTLAAGVRALAADDERLARIVERHGLPPLWARPPRFATLVRIILEQQVSLASAAALFARLEKELGGSVTPAVIHATGIAGLRASGVTRQKARYIYGLADQTLSGQFALEALPHLSDREAAEVLMEVPGIGAWTANIYLLMALLRPDVWPAGDLALRTALARLHGERQKPGLEEIEWAERWRPLRSVAARILWHGYLRDRSGGVNR